jgi:hypothetical protein
LTIGSEVGRAARVCMLGETVRRTESECPDAENGGGNRGSLALPPPWYSLESQLSILSLVEDMADEILSKPTAAGDGPDSDAGLTMTFRVCDKV